MGTKMVDRRMARCLTWRGAWCSETIDEIARVLDMPEDAPLRRDPLLRADMQLALEQAIERYDALCQEVYPARRCDTGDGEDSGD